MKTRTILVRRGPFFRIGDEWFADLFWNFGYPLPFDLDRLVRVLSTARPSTFVVGQRLDARQNRILREHRRDLEHAAFSAIFPREDERWG